VCGVMKAILHCIGIVTKFPFRLLAIEEMRGQDMEGEPYWIGQNSTTRNGWNWNPPVAKPSVAPCDAALLLRGIDN
jgi:hypothetical protein